MGMSSREPDARRAPVDRTSLAWQRTALQSSLVALFAGVTALQLGEPAVGIVAAALAGVAIVLGAVMPRVHRTTVEHHEPWPLMVRTVAVVMVTGVVTIALVAAVALER